MMLQNNNNNNNNNRTPPKIASLESTASQLNCCEACVVGPELASCEAAWSSQDRVGLVINLECDTRWILAHLLRMVMEPKYLAGCMSVVIKHPLLII